MWNWAKKIFLLICAAFPLVVFAQDYPERSSALVTDYTGTLSSSESSALEEKLVAFDHSSSSQVAVVIIKSLGGYDIESYANGLYNAWGIGGKKNNNGILILVALDDKQMRIEVGYGLEGVLPDMIAKRIIENDMKPAFRQGNYYQGLDRASDSVIAVTKGEYKAENKSKDKPFPFFVLILILGGFALLLFSRVRQARQYSRLNHIDFWAAWALINALSNKRGGNWGNFSSGRGSFGGWSGGSGGSGGGGFGGFGGGSSGGGGASGSW